MRSLRSLFFIAAFLLVASFVSAQGDTPGIKTTINKKRILVGDRIRYKVEISSPLDLEIEFPKFKDNKIGDCEIKDSGRSVRKLFFGKKTTYINWLDITSYYVGKREIPSIDVKYRERGEGNWKTLACEKLFFTVESVMPRGVRLYDIKDIKGPFYPFSFLKLLAWIIAALIAIWAAIKLLKKIWKKPPPKLPHEIAIEELEAAQKLFSSTGDTKEYYVNVSDTVRRYIETVFSLRAPEMTTQEFLSSLGDSRKLSSAYTALLKTFMEACDLVKFAKHAPSRDEIDSVFTTAKKFIEETKGPYVPV